MVMNIYFQILRKWCDKLVELQITEKSRPELNGGILCPSCGRIHGRCSDAMYPMLYLYKKTGEKKYKDCGMRLFSWSDNMYHEEGFFYNDTNSSWRGITVFSAAQLGECLLDFGDYLTAEERRSILGRFEKCAEYLREHIEEIGGNINYPVTCAYTMAVARAVTGREEYAAKAKTLAHKMMRYFTEDGLLYGEGHNRQEVSPKGCRPVDIGYNVEESLPALLQYAVMEKDEEIYGPVLKAMKTHLEFMLPDGAWDNSFGTRNYKWSYWGSRTSDGCLTGYGLTGEPVLAEAVKRNTLLLAQCTGDGLLYGGPMFQSAGEPPCVHHTFCHAKAFALLLEKVSPEQLAELNDFRRTVFLPSDLRDGARFFPSVQVLLLGKGDWRATITGYDVEYCKWGHPSGGAVSLLWHKQLGPVLAGTMGNYELVEPNNMQLLRRSMPSCLTPRIEYIRDGREYRSIYDKSASMSWQESGHTVFVSVAGKMTASDGSQGETFSLEYRLSSRGFRIKACCSGKSSLIIPLVSEEGEEVLLDGNRRELRIVRRQGAVLRLSGDRCYCLPEGSPEKIFREFSPVGGMQAVKIVFPVEKNESVSCELSFLLNVLQSHS